MNAENSVIYLEQGATLVPWAALTDSGDKQRFTPADDIMSGKAGRKPEVRPNGIVSGRNLITPGTAADTVDIAAFTAYSQGVLQSVNAVTGQAVARGVGDGYIIHSITMTSAGAIAVVSGTEGSAFSETRGAAGGPPEIPADSVELGQVRLSSTGSAVVGASEIYQVVGQHTERFDFPTWTVNNIGLGIAADEAAETNAFVKFASALPGIHASGASKKVYIQYYTPIFAELSRALDFTPVEKSHSVTSTQFYGGSVASASESLGQGGFTALLEDGIADALVADKNETLTVKFKSDRNRNPFIITQGKIGLSRTFPVADQIQASVTITAETESAEFTS